MIFGEILEKIFFPFAILTKMVLLKPESTKNLLMSYTLGRSTLCSSKIYIPRKRRVVVPKLGIEILILRHIMHYTANVLPVKNTAIASVTLCTSCWTLEITGLVTTDKTSHFSHYRY
jgi:hypothetical protein